MDLSTSVFIIITALVVVNEGKKLWGAGEVNLGYDFESKLDRSFIEIGKDKTEFDETLHKHGRHSLKWNWSTNKILKFNLEPQYRKFLGSRRTCGVHFWIHQNQTVRTHMVVTFHKPGGKTFSFRVNLKFRNWRAVSRTFAITKLRSFGEATKISFLVEQNDPFKRSGQINFDLIRLSNRCVGWGYDYINTPQIPLPYGQRNEIGGIEDLNGVYGIGNFWQGTYKWGKIDEFYIGNIDTTTPLTRMENILTKEMRGIERRVDSWYFPDDQSGSSLDSISFSKLQSLYYCDLHGFDSTSKRFKAWQRKFIYSRTAHIRKVAFASRDSTHQVCIQSAYNKLRELSNAGNGGRWPSLFASRDVLPHGDENMTGLKFNEINHRIILPLSLEYFISKRKAQRKRNLVEGSKSREHMLQVLSNELQNEPDLLRGVTGQTKNIHKTYKAIDNHRIRVVRDLHKYLISEGWDDGSGLGNTDHLLNLNAGFTISLYLLRKDLRKFNIFNNLLQTARWYNEIGELHKTPSNRNGTTADKVKGAMFGRLLTILATPYKTVKGTRQRLNDMKNLKRWVEKALEINEGYGGIIKPDFIGYHHKGVYLSAYVPNALHSLSLVAYFLHGTSFEISRNHLLNLKNALKTMAILSNTNEIPLGVSGAKVLYDNTKLNEILPAFAYLSIALGKDRTTLDQEMASLFLQHYRKHNELILKDLVEGKPYKASHYLNTIGSINLFEKVQKMARKSHIRSARQPTGNWAKNYAALSIHRRHNWTVTVKGFNKYVWDYESTVDQNVFGRYLSHGHMEIVSKRSSLLSYDLFSGWNWNRIPGTTTVELGLNELKSQAKCRYFSNTTTVGGLSLGRKQNGNGIFAMDFKQPDYHDGFYKSHPFSFSFKKSFFFIDDMIICLGSNINQSGLKDRSVITTLFQNKMKGRAGVYINSHAITRRQKINTVLNLEQPITFLDVNNNGYFVPNQDGKSSVRLQIKRNLNSSMPNGQPVTHPKVYASVTFDHGVTPSNDQYEYAVLVNSGLARLQLFKHRMSPHNLGYPPYLVLKQDEVAHVVQVHSESMVITGYAIFDADKFFGETEKHFLRNVNRPCLVMVKETSRYINIGVMDPDLRLFDTYVRYSREIDDHMLYNPISKPAWTELTFNQDVKVVTRRNKKETLKRSVSKIFYGHNAFGDVQPKIKMQLSHGFTTEVKLRKNIYRH